MRRWTIVSTRRRGGSGSCSCSARAMTAATFEAARRAGVPISNNGGANSVAVAEHALLLMLAVSRRLIWQHTNVAAGRWRTNDWNEKHLYELQGRTLGIIGLGTIGKKVARLGAAFGMDVQYYDILRLNEDAEDALGARFRLFSEVLRTSDIVSLNVPLTQATRHLIGRGRAVPDEKNPRY